MMTRRMWHAPSLHVQKLRSLDRQFRDIFSVRYGAVPKRRVSWLIRFIEFVRSFFRKVPASVVSY